MSNKTRYPIYIPSKGRSDISYTADCLIRDDVPFRLVIERQEEKVYADKFGKDNILVLPFNNQGSVIPARNWIKEHAIAEGHLRHWQLDDNIKDFYRWWRGTRIRCNSAIALRVTEDFTDRYENVALAGLQYSFFAIGRKPPFNLNCHVYSCTLVLNSLPHKWRGRYNEDTDMCLQVLADGWCTVLINAFLADKIETMRLKGGNTDELYYDDGRLRMARSLERQWPGVVGVTRRFRRPQHSVKDAWKRFDTPLKRKENGKTQDTAVNEYGMKLAPVQKIKSTELKKMVEDYGEFRKTI